MPCFHPLQAWRANGNVTLGLQPRDAQSLQLPCGNCLGCRTARAQAWALRCQLELQEHTTAIFATITYDDQHKPLTLAKPHVTAFIKKLRKAASNRLRFFASGEYGETTNRPHYHAIIYGLSEREIPQLETTWAKGHIHADKATPANIAYTAGYCSKKIGYKRQPHERVDPNTGEVYQWQPPFILMSRNPGIGARARDKFLNAWRLYAIKDGHKMSVPRYFKQRWKDNATPEDLEKLENELIGLNLHVLSKDELKAAEKNAEARHKLTGEKRHI